MFFTQHPPEIVGRRLWAGQFFIARRNSSVNVTVRRRGEPQVDSSGAFGSEGIGRVLGTKGAFKGVQFTRPETEPSHGKTMEVRMKMVKSLLLGSAAGLVAVSAGQAADLPVKAKPVEYVKVCSLYGAGFYYIPGTDTCIKLGGFLRTEWNFHSLGSFAPFVNSNSTQLRTEDNFITRARASLTADVREQTSYGTLRAYFAAGWQYTTDDAPTVSLPGAQSVASASTTTFSAGGNGNLYLLRAFIQWGGFTFGKTASFYDFFNTSKYSNQSDYLYQDFGGNGIFTYGYTQQLGNGMAATIAIQDPSPFEKPIVEVSGSESLTEFFDFGSGGALPSASRLLSSQRRAEADLGDDTNAERMLVA